MQPVVQPLLQLRIILLSIRSTVIMCQAYGTNYNSRKRFTTFIACSSGLALWGLAGFVTNIMGAALPLKRATGARWSVETTVNIPPFLG